MNFDTLISTQKFDIDKTVEGAQIGTLELKCDSVPNEK